MGPVEDLRSPLQQELGLVHCFLANSDLFPLWARKGTVSFLVSDSVELLLVREIQRSGDRTLD